MDVSEAIQKRVTIRRWKPRPVEKEKIVKVLEAGGGHRNSDVWGLFLVSPSLPCPLSELLFLWQGVFRVTRILDPEIQACVEPERGGLIPWPVQSAKERG